MARLGGRSRASPCHDLLPFDKIWFPGVPDLTTGFWRLCLGKFPRWLADTAAMRALTTHMENNNKSLQQMGQKSVHVLHCCFLAENFWSLFGTPELESFLKDTGVRVAARIPPLQSAQLQRAFLVFFCSVCYSFAHLALEQIKGIWKLKDNSLKVNSWWFKARNHY